MPGGFRVITPWDRVDDGVSGSMRRQAAVSKAQVGAQKLWVGYVELPGKSLSAAHHHGEAESVIYLISGAARFYVGDDLSEIHDARAGDFIWVPPHTVHIEASASTEPLRMIVSRSTQEQLVFHVPTPEGWQPK